MQIVEDQLKLTTAELERARINELKGFKLVESKTEGHWRHGSENSGILKHKESGKFFSIGWRDSVKETMMFMDMNMGPFTFSRVYPHKKTITVYKNHK